MTPREQIEALALEFDDLAKVAERHYRLANEPLKDRLIVGTAAKWHKGSADSHRYFAERLRDLLKLKGWE